MSSRAEDVLPNYYEVLGLKSNATPEQIKHAYRALSLLHHPDKNRDADATAKFQKISMAHIRLSHPSERIKYDFELYLSSKLYFTSQEISFILFCLSVEDIPSIRKAIKHNLTQLVAMGGKELIWTLLTSGTGASYCKTIVPAIEALVEYGLKFLGMQIPLPCILLHMMRYGTLQEPFFRAGEALKEAWDMLLRSTIAPVFIPIPQAERPVMKQALSSLNFAPELIDLCLMNLDAYADQKIAEVIGRHLNILLSVDQTLLLNIFTACNTKTHALNVVSLLDSIARYYHRYIQLGQDSAFILSILLSNRKGFSPYDGGSKALEKTCLVLEAQANRLKQNSTKPFFSEPESEKRKREVPEVPEAPHKQSKTESVEYPFLVLPDLTEDVGEPLPPLFFGL